MRVTDAVQPVHPADGARIADGALGGWRGEAYLSGNNTVQECAWWTLVGALCS